MSYNAFVSPQTRQVNKAAIAAGTPGVASAARWFWWIAGLSLVNTILVHSGSETSFVIGLGFTLIADYVFQSMKLIAFAVDALALGFFVFIGWRRLKSGPLEPRRRRNSAAGRPRHLTARCTSRTGRGPYRPDTSRHCAPSSR